MANRQSRIPETRETTEMNCMWRLLSILQSCQGLTGPKLISNGRPVNRHLIDHQRKLEHLTSFDGECRKIQNADVARVTLNGSTRGSKNLVLQDFSTTNNPREMIAKDMKMDSALVDDLANAHRRARKKRDKEYQSSLSRLDNAAGSTHLPSSSAEISLNRLTLAALLDAASAQNHPEEDLHSERVQPSLCCNQADPVSMHRVHISAKAFADQMFTDRERTCKQRGSMSESEAESKSFSDALEVLNSNKDRIMDLFPEPDSLLSRESKNFRPSKPQRETIKSLLDAKFAEYRRENARTSGSTLVIQKGKMNKHSEQKMDYQRSCSLSASFKVQPSDKIVVLEPASQSARNFEYVICHCTSVQSHRKLSRMKSDAKSSSFTFRETKKKLKHAFGSPKKELNQCSVYGTSDAFARSKSTREAYDDCKHCGVDRRRSFTSSVNDDLDRKLWKKQELKSNRDFDVACATDATVGQKQEFDVILEAKRRLSERLRKLNGEVARDETSPRTLRRILASPEYEFCPLSPRWESQYCPGSAQMRVSPYYTSLGATENTTQVPNGREWACLGPLRPNSMMASCDDTQESSLIPVLDQGHESDIYALGNKKSMGEPQVVETNGIQEPEPCNSEVASEINIEDVAIPMQMADTTESHKDDDSVVHSLSDSLSENEAFTSTGDYFQSTPSSIYQLDVADNLKYQEEHQSPVSVLEPFFIEDANSPQNTTLQTAQRTLQPLRLDFEEQSNEPFSHNPQVSQSSCMDEQDHLTEYVYLILEASCLDWDQLSRTNLLPEELLHATLFDEVEYLLTDCFFDPKLLFDHINEVLIDIHRSHFCSRPSTSPIKPQAMSEPLAKLVLNEIMTQADFYLLPRTEKRTLDQLVSKDVENSRSWLNVRLETEQIVVDISEDLMEEYILDTLLESAVT